MSRYTELANELDELRGRISWLENLMVGPGESDPAPSVTDLLTEIRDLLRDVGPVNVGQATGRRDIKDEANVGRRRDPLPRLPTFLGVDEHSNSRAATKGDVSEVESEGGQRSVVGEGDGLAALAGPGDLNVGHDDSSADDKSAESIPAADDLSAEWRNVRLAFRETNDELRRLSTRLDRMERARAQRRR